MSVIRCAENLAKVLLSQERARDRDTPVGAIRRHGSYVQADFTESTLSQLPEDPVIRLLMSSDGVDPSELRALFADLRARLARDETAPGEAGRI